MNVNFYRSPGNVCFLLISFCLLIGQSKTANAQSVTQAQKDFDKLAKAYHADSISTTQYLHLADSLASQFEDYGLHFKTTELSDLLKLYEEIAWSKEKYGEYREQYYNVFYNNARRFGQAGASMYYAEKLTQEYKKNGEKHPLLEVRQKCDIYLSEALYDKVFAVYKTEEAYLKQLPTLLRNKQASEGAGMDALVILSYVTLSYINTYDTVAVHQTVQLADQIGAAMQSRYPIKRPYMLYNDFFIFERKQIVASFEKNHPLMRSLLDSIETLKTIYKDQPTGFIDFNLIRRRLFYYLDVKNVDSTRAYIKKLESPPFYDKNQQGIIDKYKGQLQAMQGDFRGAYALTDSALEEEQKAETAMTTEMDNLLYAYTEAEHSKIDLRKAEAVKEQRTIWLLVISLSAALIILAIYFIMLRKDRKAKAQVAALNDAANMQIIAMEEVKHQAVREEQQRLGQDLHDGLSSSIAGIRHQLETLSMDTTDVALKNKLDTLQSALAGAYDHARNKSHEWFSAADAQQEQSFEKRIQLLTDHALPDSRYHKTIQIDDTSLTRVNTDTRIALLRIIQEAITNIIKHAKAKNVGILIYEETDSLVLTINDDGKGLGEKKPGNEKPTMGLQSIQRRVRYLNGETKIHSDTKGTEIMVSIPFLSL